MLLGSKTQRFPFSRAAASGFLVLQLLLLSSCLCYAGEFDCNWLEREGERHQVSALKIATFNAEWLFDGKDDPSYSPWHEGKTSCPGMKHCGTEEGAKLHIDKVSEYVKLLNADILNVVEVENCEVLRKVINRSDISEYRPLLKKGIDTATKQNVGMLTKLSPLKPLYRLDERQAFPVEGSECGYSKEGKRTTLSKNYVAHFGINNMTIAVHSMHLKAFPKDPYSCAKREGQAKIAQASIRESVRLGHEVVVFGDLNDFSREYQDIQGSVPKSRVLSILKDTGEGYEDLTNVMRYLEEKDRYSSWWDKNNNHQHDGTGELSQIDHVLLTPRLASYVTGVEIFHGYDPALVSDHWPVVVNFNFNQGGNSDSSSGQRSSSSSSSESGEESFVEALGESEEEEGDLLSASAAVRIGLLVVAVALVGSLFAFIVRKTCSKKREAQYVNMLAHH